MNLTPFFTFSTLTSYPRSLHDFFTIDNPNPNWPFIPFLYGENISFIILSSILSPSLNNINFLFDHDQIAEIIHKGLESEQQQELNNTLKKYLNDLKDRDNFYNADQPLNSSVSKETTLNTMNLMEENNE